MRTPGSSFEPDRVGRWARGALLAAVAAALLGPPAPLEGQSLLGSGGLGMPAEPLDARARALGGAGVGLPGWAILPTDPSAAAGLRLPGITATFQPTSGSLEGEEGSFGNTRFPVIGASYPFGRNVFSLFLASYLEQDWQVRRTVTLELAGEQVEAEDVFRSEGGIGQFRVGWARRVGETVAVGASAGILTGSLERSFTREMDPDQVGPDVNPFRSSGRWRASGPVATAGASWQAMEVLRVGGSVTWAGDLDLEPVGATEGGSRTISLPIEYRVGGTVTLIPRLSLSAGASYADWSDAAEGLTDGGTRDTAWSYGAGAEWTGARLLGRPTPFRIGVRSRDLPFLFQGEAISERALTGGFGINLADAEDVPVARLELGLQRGSRSGGELSEDFTRISVTIRLAGG